MRRDREGKAPGRGNWGCPPDFLICEGFEIIT